MKTLFTILILAIMLLFVVAGLSGINRSTDPDEMDTGSYLRTVIEINMHGSLPGLLARCISGEYRQANRHPLYMLLLSTRARRSIDFCVDAKIIALLLGGLYLISLFLVTYRLFSLPVAAATTLRDAKNRLFLIELQNSAVYLQMVAC